jgi:hypothetical protein
MSSLDGAMSKSESESSLQSLEHDATKVLRISVLKIFSAMSEIQGDMAAFKSLMAEFPQYNGSAPLCGTGPANVLTVFVLEDYSAADQDSLARGIEQLLAGDLEDLEKAAVRRVSFIVSKDDKADKNLYPLPSVFTFREVDAFKGDHL